ncbi:MAG: SurA N-terminal domain-containing protein [Patescibacteria group bacterium]|nr:SurA N-terminal domain-containing protein [Patescibacteria group bacterium]
MNIFRKHKKVWIVIVAISTIALIAASFAPFLLLR